MAIRAAGIGFWHWDVEKDKLDWDDSMSRLYGLSSAEFADPLDAWWRCLIDEKTPRTRVGAPAEVRGNPHWTHQTFLELVVPEDRGWLSERMRGTLKAQGRQLELRMPDSTPRWRGPLDHGDRPLDTQCERLDHPALGCRAGRHRPETDRGRDSATEHRAGRAGSPADRASWKPRTGSWRHSSYSISHDLQSPLRAIDGLFEPGAQGPMDRSSRTKRRRRLHSIRESAQRMGMLIDDLLRFSKLGRRPLTRAPVDMESARPRVLRRTCGPARPSDRSRLRSASAAAHAEGDPALVEAGLGQPCCQNAIGSTARLRVGDDRVVARRVWRAPV